MGKGEIPNGCRRPWVVLARIAQAGLPPAEGSRGGAARTPGTQGVVGNGAARPPSVWRSLRVPEIGPGQGGQGRFPKEVNSG